jgi:hypothetical protein
MTKQRDFKALVRERMAKTGERYTTARTHLLARTIGHSQPAKAFRGVLEGYATFGGQQSGTGAIHNVLRRQRRDRECNRGHGAALRGPGRAEILRGELRVLGPCQVERRAHGSEEQARLAGDVR